MCEYCGCRGVEPIAELMDEHSALADEAHEIRKALDDGDRDRTLALLMHLAGHITRHTGREEAGLFTALRDKDEFLDELGDLEGEHRHLDSVLAGLDPDADDFGDVVTRLLDDLSVHIEREELGVFPVSVVTLGVDGWDVVERSRTESPSFLLDPRTPETGDEHDAARIPDGTGVASP
jgi:hemerythrin-like domain-containing protein